MAGSLNTVAHSLLHSWRWPLMASLLSLLILGAAHAFERFALLAPCPLCLRQREVYWALIAMALTGLVLFRLRPNRRFVIALDVMMGLVFVTGAVVAGYHTGVEQGWWPPPEGCATGDAAARGAAAAPDGDLLGSLDQRMAASSCTDSLWHFAGLSMAAWNVVLSAGLAALSFAAAFATARLSRSEALRLGNA